MISVLSEIEKLRNSPIVIDYKNNNRYCAVLYEENDTKTAYYFSTPIYNVKTRKAVDFKFYKTDNGICMTGSNSTVTITDKIRMESGNGNCTILVEKPITFISHQQLKCGDCILHPTTNGIVFDAPCNDKGFSIELISETQFMQLRSNDKYFSLMNEKFRPLITASCIGTADESGNIIAPAKVEYQQLDEYRYRINVVGYSPFGKRLLFEVNMYEPKLMQDTTVESFNPKINNSFGGTAFIGNTAQFGEQWLYSRLDYPKISELVDKRVFKAVIHYPKHNISNVELSAFRAAARFCSFGSNWDNKIPIAENISDSILKDEYLHIDVLGLLTDANGRTVNTDGMIIKPKFKDSGFCVVSTADSCYAPQIIEINYR